MGVTIEDDVFIGANLSFISEIFPRSKVSPEPSSKTRISKGTSIVVKATIFPGITIGINAIIGAGSVVVKNVSDNTIFVGNPARIKKNL
ncbi:DapH/DapD/GlmU-related protein [Undibacterium sp.]|uniref:DapH/DapD/GlmU-related protein n=1 Tax=Undibacterium sp. TaxID=1914977 RepID=UPI00345B8261